MNKLRIRDKIGYSSAAIGDALSYLFISTFILFFLTTVAGLQPAVAGALTAVGAVADAIANPIMGYLSDHARTKWGRRRPFMLGFCAPLLIAIILLYTNVEFSYGLKVLYYGIMLIIFWVGFTGFFVPFYALGAEYTNDYDERTSLRTFASIFNMIGTVFAMAMPTLMVEFFGDKGLSTERAWQLTAAFLACFSVISIIVTVFSSKSFDHPNANSTIPDMKDSRHVGVKDMFREYFEVLRLKPMKWLLITSMFYLVSYALIMSDFVYFLTYNLGYTGSGVSILMLIRCGFCLIFIPIVARLCLKCGKRTGLIMVVVFGMIGLTVMRVIPISNTFWLMIFLAISAITTQTYWQIMPAIFYDVCEYDEYETGNRREGSILSVQGLIEAVAAGIGAQVLGIILQFAGFNGSVAVQTELAMSWIYNCTTWVPAIFLLVAGFALYKFSLTREEYNRIVRELEKRKSENNEGEKKVEYKGGFQNEQENK